MKKIRILLWSIILVFAGIVIFNACSKNESKNSATSARLELRLTDSPDPNVKEVWVDIQDIKIHVNNDTSENGWINLTHIYPGIYNLLDLTNGKDTILADSEIPAGQISQIRLLLGSNNYIVTKDGLSHDLTTPSAQQSGLKLNLHQDVSGGVLYRLILDFDAAHSIVKAGNSGKFLLKPVIRVLSFVPSGGIIKGIVLPDSVITAVFAISGVDTVASTFTGTGGGYMIKDIPAGTYSLHYEPTDTSFKSDIRNDINVVLGQTTVVDTVKLQK